MDDDGRCYDDVDEPLPRVVDDGYPVDADAPLPPGIYFSRLVEAEVDGYDDDGNPDGAFPEHIETTRITIAMARRMRIVPKPVHTTAVLSIGGGQAKFAERPAAPAPRVAARPADKGTNSHRIGSTRAVHCR